MTEDDVSLSKGLAVHIYKGTYALVPKALCQEDVR
jgi:hypothetical protein